MDSKYVFISYSHNDFEKVITIINAMKDRGISVWYDEGIEAGTEWPEYIAERIESASAFIAFISPSAVASTNCRNEINYALSLNKDILVVHLEKTDLSAGMKLQIGTLQAMFYERSKSEDEFINNLLDSKILQKLSTAEAVTGNHSVLESPLSKPKKKKKNEQSTKKDEIDHEALEAYYRREKAMLASKIMIPLFVALAVVLSSIEMYFVTKYVQNGFWIFLFGVLTPLLVLIPLNIVYRFKTIKFSYSARSDIFDFFLGSVLFAFFAQVIIDVFCINSTDNIFFKILISIGINILPYIIALVSATSY